MVKLKNDEPPKHNICEIWMGNRLYGKMRLATIVRKTSSDTEEKWLKQVDTEQKKFERFKESRLVDDYTIERVFKDPVR